MKSKLRWHSFALAASMTIAIRAHAQQGGAQIPQSRAPVQPSIQQVESCIAGRVFGITQYQCTHCGMSSPRDSTRVVYSFGAEPIVIATDDPSRGIKPGDAVVAVNGNPIMTRAGADQFAYPPQGMATLTVRRNNNLILNIEQPVLSTRYCPPRGFISLDSVQRANTGAIAVGRGGGRGGARTGGGGGGGAIRGPDGAILTAAQTDSVMARLQRSADSARARGGVAARGVMVRTIPPERTARTVELSTLGLTLTCNPSCTYARVREGTAMYWRFDAFPTITNPSPTSPAGKAGLRDGDTLRSVNDVSPMVEEGGLLLTRAATAVQPSTAEQTLRLEISRDGKIQKITLKF